MDRSEQLAAWQTYLTSLGLMSFPLFGVLNGRCRCQQGEACPNPGKHPKIKGWRNLTEPASVGALDNLGVATDKLVVVDFDASQDRPQDLPETFTVFTARGMHLWYWADPKHPIRNATSWRPKVDIRSVGGLVASPPSMTVKGTEYTYMGGEIVPVPAIVTETRDKYMPRERRAITQIPEETPALMESMAEALALEVIGAPSGERNATLFRVGCRFFELAEGGWLGADALNLIIEAAVHVGLSPTEARATLDSASKNLSG